ncbi:DUF368 domain-containing protein [Capnocytophaga catalasegens]|uniref:DUF368 domain-containing protein n=1 Tax=Capnocytophaga catalasegens TaxID=1004260 RepID=A0AAV5AX95_9FLAO|nr:DUF368 domain-containing protein [Capnocytophaga catalasegens]GIZ15382.1 DUF368 domain-containing protein [Capnocytophaga catalasegens]GJM50970.1 DUF368 domain-containing protein [Capnocytophaga catalasegens]GJM52154.1 DUF368 domain-containing protein [Capnocytophaga catalasegens]
MKRKKIDYFFITLKGIAMGAADVVPGVSGGTIAFIAGIYEELISSINNINLKAFKILKNDGFNTFWKHINGNFFLALLSGIFISILSLAKGVKWLLENEPIGVWSFFFGLMIASIFFLAKDIQKWGFVTILAMLFSGIIAYIITIIPPLASHSGLVYIFFSGALAICAMILPGISGAFILVLLGAYHTILVALDNWNLSIIGVFALGAIFGILSFSKALKWLFTHYRNTTIAGLTGFIIGSLNKVWPWKEVLRYGTDSHGNQVAIWEKSILPTTYDGNPQIIMAISLAFVGFSLLYGLEKWASSLKKN